MIVIEKNAEVKLLDELKNVRYQTAGVRIIHYSFSSLGEKEKSVVQELLTTELINSVLDNSEAKLYICEDSDVIIVGQNIFTKSYDKLNQAIYHLLNLTNLLDIAKMYDVDNSWAQVYKLIKDKCEIIEKRNLQKTEEEKKLTQEVEKEQILTAKNIDPELIKSISERRKRRTAINVLTVEDDAFSRKLIRNILNKQYDVIDVEDGKDALSTYAIISPDVTFLDIDLPDVNGHDLLKTLLRIDPEAYIVMLSGNSDQDNVIRAIKAGAKGFVTKPFLKERLFKYIEDAPTVSRKALLKKGELV